MAEVVLDACAVIAAVFGEPAMPRVRAALVAAEACGRPLPMCVVNWGEAVYDVMRRHREPAHRAVVILQRLPIALVDADRTLTTRAAALKAAHGIGYADAYAAALALTLGMPLMTGDADFRVLEPFGLKLDWIGA